MAGEGGGGGASVALGFGPALAKIFAKKPRSAYERYQSGQQWAQQWQAARASPEVPRPDVQLPRTAAIMGLASGFAATPRGAQPPAQPPPPPPQQPTQLGDLLAAAQRGLERGMAISAVIDAIRALFQKPPKPPTVYLPDWLFQPIGVDPMAYTFGPANYGTDLMMGAGSLASGIASVINAIRSPSNMPGGMSFLPSLGTIGTIARGAGSIATGVGLGWAGAELMQGGGAGCPTSPFTAGGSSARPTIFVAANPVTGKATWFRPAGRPILWSSDLSACRRVRKVAGRARRRLGGR